MSIKRNFLIVLPLAIILSGIAFGTVYYLNSQKPNNSITTQESDQFKVKVCSTTSCLKHAKHIMESIDTTVDPCESFYEFTCGKFMKKPLSDDESSLSSFKTASTNLNRALSTILSKPIDENDDNISANVKKFYSSCMNLDQINSNSERVLLEILNTKLKGWPLLTNKENNLTILDLLNRVNKFQLPFFQTIYIGTNPKNTKAKIIRISQTKSVNKEYYLKESFKNAYRNFFNSILNYLGTKVEDTTSDINDVIELSHRLAKVEMSQVEQKHTDYVNMTIKELQAKVPKFPWIELIINGLYKNNDHQVHIDENEYVIIDNWNYTVAAADIFEEYTTKNKKTVQNYIFLAVFNKFIDGMPLKYLQAKIGFSKFINGESELKNRTSFCTDLTTNNFQAAVGRIYVSSSFDSRSKVKVLDMSNYMIDEFKLMLDQVNWMDEVSRKLAREKVDAIRTQIGYPDNIFNQTYMNKFNNFNINENELLENIYTISKNDILLHFNELRRAKDKNEWGFTSAVVNAFYDPETNQIYFPAGILQPPFYFSNLPNFINYGSIGAAIGHEITHGFDDSGRLFDKDGVFFSENEAGLWTSETSHKFKEKSKCMIDQYSSYFVKSIKKNLNGEQTLGENIADNGGIKESFRAYRKWVAKNGEEPLLPGLSYTQDQLFFMSLGLLWCSKSRDETMLSQVLSDPHSPGEFRIKGMFSNYEEFGKAFNCKPRLNQSSEDCSIW